jgi:putative peptide zinc metalloprotease protein
LRAVSVTASLAAGVTVLLLAVPVPLTTTAEGVIAPPEQSEIRAAAAGIVKRLIAEPGTRVTRGQPLIETEDVFLDAEVRLLSARLRGLKARYDALRGAYLQLRAELIKEEIAVVRADLDAAKTRLDSLVLHSPTDGVFVVDRPESLPGLFLRRGDLVGYVLDVERPTVRVAIPQSDIGLVRRQTRAVQVRLAERLDTVVPASIVRQVPAASNRLPGPALGPLGGGPFPVDPNDVNGTTTLEAIFEVRLRLPIAVDKLGGRVYALFEHGREPLAQQWYRRFRQLFLRRFNV